MKAIGFNRHGGADVLESLELEDPKPGSNDVIVRLYATSVNRLDILSREGVHGMKIEMPHIPGVDIVGTVEKMGKNVKKFSEGELVISNTVYGCGVCSNCVAGNDNLCSKWNCFGLQVNGSYGELLRIPERLLSKPPSIYTKTELAAMPHSLSVAWRALHTLGSPQADDNLFIRGASGNTGIFIVMLAKALGLKVITASRSKKKTEELKRLGADYVLDSNESPEAIKNNVMSITDGKGADIIIDMFGSTLNESLNFAAFSSRIISFGTISGGESKINIKRLYLWNVSLFGMHNAGKPEFDAAFEFASKNNIHPLIAKRLSITKAAEGHRSLENSEYFGKIILEH